MLHIFSTNRVKFATRAPTAILKKKQRVFYTNIIQQFGHYNNGAGRGRVCSPSPPQDPNFNPRPDPELHIGAKSISVPTRRGRKDPWGIIPSEI